MKINIFNRQKKVEIDSSLFGRIAKYAAGKFNSSKDVELNIVFAGKEEIADLNKKYRNTHGPTDVLSFSYLSYQNPGEKSSTVNTVVSCNNQGLLQFFKSSCPYAAGEIIISPEVAEENVKNKNKKDPCWNVNREITLLIVHGVLHIYDYDHDNRQNRVEMENIQKSILNDLLSNFTI